MKLSNNIELNWLGREWLSFSYLLDSAGVIQSAKLRGIGSSRLIELVKKYRSLFVGQLKEIPLPVGSNPEVLAMREVILRAQGKWDFPYKEDELCHCRGVPTCRVDLAICSGAHTVRQVRERTSASTACGTCKPDIEAILNWRIPKS